MFHTLINWFIAFLALTVGVEDGPEEDLPDWLKGDLG